MKNYKELSPECFSFGWAFFILRHFNDGRLFPPLGGCVIPPVTVHRPPSGEPQRKEVRMFVITGKYYSSNIFVYYMLFRGISPRKGYKQDKEITALKKFDDFGGIS